MLMAQAAVLKDLVGQYLTLRQAHAENGGDEIRRRMNDAAYTLCVSTGTRDVDTALIVARHGLALGDPHTEAASSKKSA